MAVIETAKPNFVQRTVTFYNDVMLEMRKVTWPDKAQVRQATIGILVVVLLIGALIFAIDWLAQTLLVRLPASLLGR